MKRKGKQLLIVLAIVLYSCSIQAQEALLNGTIIITLISKDTIWLGADSRTSALTEKGYSTNQNGMCKIYSTNDVIYAMAGHVRYTDNSFNFIEIMRNCIAEQDDFSTSMKLFESKATKEIRSILKKFSVKSINTLVKTNNGSFLSVVAISFVNGEKKVKEMKFSIKTVGTNNWKVIYNQTEDFNVGTLRFVGHASNASGYVNNNQQFFGNGRNVPGKIIDLIKLESAKGKGTVGMPADVISIYNNGFKKVITSGLCR